MATSEFESRNYQTAAVKKILDILRQPNYADHRTILDSPTGSGKTAMAVRVFTELSPHPTMIFLVRGNDLIAQTVASFEGQGVQRVRIGVEQAGSTVILDLPKVLKQASPAQLKPEVSAMVTSGPILIIASVPSVASHQGRRWLALLDSLYAANPTNPPVVMYDECHHAASAVNRTRIVEPALDRMHRHEVFGLVGLSGTPFRPDFRTEKLEALFGTKKQWVRIAPHQLYRDGYLVPTYTTRLGVISRQELSRIERLIEDYKDDALEALVDQPHITQAIVDAAEARVQADRYGVVYATTVRHAQHLQAALIERGIVAPLITSETPPTERQEILEAFRRGEVHLMVNVMVLTEGFDAPRMDYIILGRPTRSPVLYQQIRGRLQRPFGVKSQGEIVTLTGGPSPAADPDGPVLPASSEVGDGAFMLEALRKRVLAESRRDLFTASASETAGPVVDTARLLNRFGQWVVPWVPVGTSKMGWYAGTLIPADNFIGSWGRYAWAQHVIVTVVGQADENGLHPLFAARARKKAGTRSWQVLDTHYPGPMALGQINRAVVEWAKQIPDEPVATTVSQWLEMATWVSRSELPSLGYSNYTGWSGNETRDAIIRLVAKSKALSVDQAYLHQALIGGYNGFPIQSAELAKLRLILSGHSILLGFTKAAINLNLFLENKFAAATSKDYSTETHGDLNTNEEEEEEDNGEDDEKQK